jgi:transposase InsO family protein
MKPDMQTNLVTDVLRMACFRRQPEPGLIFHSDRDSQYCSHEFQRALRGYGMRSSMSRKGNCWDNSPTESLWAHLKVGRLHSHRFATLRQAMDEVVAWLTFYNYRRLHSSLGYLSPCSTSSAGMRHSARTLHRTRAKNYGKQGQGQACESSLTPFRYQGRG